MGQLALTYLSAHFTLEEFTHSQTALRKHIGNTPDEETLARLRMTAQQLERVRELLGAPMTINSAYRSPELNAAVGGASGSAHTLGYAVDFICPSVGTPLQICQRIKTAQIKLDQCIQEGTWVHISFDPRYRNEYLTAIFMADGTNYTRGIG